MRIALAQVDTAVGDPDGNRLIILRAIREAEVLLRADLVCFSELCLCGYPPEDLLLKRDFLGECTRALLELAREVGETVAVVGTLDVTEDLFNAAAVMHRGELIAMYHKHFLPNYGVFDEKRYFQAGAEPALIKLGDLKIAITICFDIWNIEWLRGFLKDLGPIGMILNISASPFHSGKIKKIGRAHV